MFIDRCNRVFPPIVNVDINKYAKRWRETVREIFACFCCCSGEIIFLAHQENIKNAASLDSLKCML